jgi:hypothetical protein
VVDGADLENRCGVKATEGSNPSLSAAVSSQPLAISRQPIETHTSVIRLDRTGILEALPTG